MPEALFRSPGTLMLFLCLPVPVIFLAGFFPLLFGATNRRPKLVLSALIGMGLIAGGFWGLPVLDRTLDLLAFRRNVSVYDRLVVQERSKSTLGKPMRLVVNYWDRSLFVASPIFEFVIFDETDQAAVDPKSITGFWPYPESPSGTISMDGNEAGRRTVWQLSGHYYGYAVE